MAAMNLINVENITKSYTDSLLFDEASFTVDEQEKVGIIGINGTGKTTLLRMIVGLETPEKGTITRANHIVIRYLPQHPSFRDHSTVLEAVMEGNLRHDNEWSLESEAKTMLQKLGITDYDQIVDSVRELHWQIPCWRRQMYWFWTSLRTTWILLWQTGWRSI